MNYQGFLVSADGLPVVGSKFFRFRVRNGNQGPIQWDSECLIIPVQNGQFLAILGDTNQQDWDVIDWGGIDAFLEVMIGDSCSNFESLWPQERIFGVAIGLDGLNLFEKKQMKTSRLGVLGKISFGSMDSHAIPQVRGELVRFAGPGHPAGSYKVRVQPGANTDDLPESAPEGQGRIGLAWNAYWDYGSHTWRSLVSGELHTFLGIGSSRSGSNAGGNVFIGAAPSSEQVGDPVLFSGLVIGQGGNVGIGTMSPKEELHVVGDARIENGTGARLSLMNTTTGKEWRIISRHDNGFGIANVTDGLVDRFAPFYISPEGNIGIGTTSPANHPLHIFDDGDNASLIRLENQRPTILFMDTDGSHDENYQIRLDRGTLRFNRQDDSNSAEKTNVAFTSDGNVGIGTTEPLASLDVAGDVKINGVVMYASDLRFKREVHTIKNALDKIMKLRGVQFYWKGKSRNQSLQMGMIGQEVEEVVPNLVYTMDDEMDSKFLSYNGIIAILVEAIKGQEARIEELESRLGDSR